LRAFSEVDYWFQITLQNGETYTSPKTTFLYRDNRFDWDMIESAPLRVHWHTGDIAFAQEILNIAQAGVQRAQQILPQVLVPPAIDVYVYSNGEELRGALLASSQKWIAGHADPDLNVALVSLPPGPEQRLEMERQIPHELMHVMMYYTDGNAYANLPAWFNEGLASMAELYPNPDYQVLMQNAYQTNSLMPLGTLCKVFPTDPHKALLAYAESASFMNFLFEKYGSAGFESLIALYAQGQSCEQAIETSFNASLSSLENQWQRQNFVRNSMQTALEDLLPWLIVIIVVLAGPLILAISMFRHRAARVEL
jgi:Peptidase MA superfamily